jgi:hypothetical protein
MVFKVLSSEPATIKNNGSPTDYNNAKMRVSKLRVVAEHKEAMTKPTLTKGYMHDNTVADDAEW